MRAHTVTGCGTERLLTELNSFRARLLKSAGPACFRRFLKHSEAYVDAVAREAELREQGQVLDLISFEPLRRENSAIRLCFGLFEFALGIDLPDEVFEDEAFMNLYWAAADMVCWANVSSFQDLDAQNGILTRAQDVYSYNMEQARGIGGNNIVTVLMEDRGVNLQSASDMVGKHFAELMSRFVEGKKKLPSWGLETDAAVAAYIRAMEHWVVGNLDWSFETQRYFGPTHAAVKESLTVFLKPREVDDY